VDAGKLVIVRIIDRPPGPMKKAKGLVVKVGKAWGVGYVCEVLIDGTIHKILEENILEVIDELPQHQTK